jgi:hypothetical protein
LAWVAGDEVDFAALLVMARKIGKAYVVLRRTEVIGDNLKLPRPKITQELALIGDKETCMEFLEDMSRLPINQSTDIIRVDLTCVPYTGQRNYNSKETTKNNGKTRNPSDLT